VATCILRIGDRVALASVGGAPEVEYGLFDPGEIELAATGPGRVQEVGYQTTVEEAIARLKDGGVTWPMALETASAVQPTLAMRYSRGAAIRRIANALGPAELFEGFRFDPATKVYEGRWLELPALERDARVPRLTQTLQAMHLLALLLEEKPGDPVRLVTRELMATAKSGGRSYRRYAWAPTSTIPNALRALAEQLRASPPTDADERAEGATSAELLDTLRDRIVLLPEGDSQDRLRAIEKAVGIREQPLRGPLSDPQLWALEERLSAGRTEGVVEAVDAFEKARGKQPATAYLRARAALLSGREAPRAIAERIATVALAMPSFIQLELLATEAWNAAGEPKRALPFARDLISNTSLTDELRVRESQIPAPRRSTPAPMSAPRVPLPSTVPTAPELDLVSARVAVGASSKPPASAPSLPGAGGSPRDSGPESVRRRTQLFSSSEPPRAMSPPPLPRRPPPPEPSSPSLQPEASRRATPPMSFDAVSLSREPGAPAPMPTTRSPLGPGAKRPISGTWVGPAPSAPKAPRARTNPGGASSGRPPSPAMADVSTRPTSRPAVEAPRIANPRTDELMRGASQPPFRSDSPDAHVNVPRAPALPRFGDAAEAATALTLPDGLAGVPEPIETLPRTVLDARVQFTFLSRELGRQYDEQLGIDLRADISGVEAMQRVLLERYSSRTVASPEAAADVRRHGAFLSEILARSFGAFWVDIGPSDVGYWAMVVPPGTRVWPFGRILRFIAMQHNERDLVSYFLELQTRGAAGR